MTVSQPATTPWWGAELLDGQPNDAIWARTGREITWAELRDKVQESVGIFTAHGVGLGSSVALRLPPSLTGIWSLLALWSLGAQVQLLDHRLKPAEVQRILDLCEPRYYIHTSDKGHSASFREEYEVFVEWRRTGSGALTDHCLVQFSSGSTGRPKAIGRTARSLREELEAFSRIPQMPRAGERVLLLNSTIHSLGLIGGVLHAMNTGATLVFTTKLQPPALMETLAVQDINAVFGVPFHYDLLSRVPNPPVLPRLRLAVSGGERLTEEVHNRFAERYGIRIGQAYGMTETGIVATDLAGEFALPTVGTVVPGMHTRVRDGELWIRLDRSPYLQDEGAERYVDGWLNSHDLAHYCEINGTLKINGRSDSLVAVGGLKVNLMEIENELARHPAVREIVVVYGDGIEAHVGASDELTSSELLSFARERLSNFKIPRRMHISSALPRTANGKLLRSADLLRAAYADAPAHSAGPQGGVR